MILKDYITTSTEKKAIDISSSACYIHVFTTYVFICTYTLHTKISCINLSERSNNVLFSMKKKEKKKK